MKGQTCKFSIIAKGEKDFFSKTYCIWGKIIKSMGQGEEKPSDQMTVSGDNSNKITVDYYVN